MDSSSFPRFISGPLSRLGLVSMLLVASALPIRAQMASTSASTLRVSPTVSHAHPGTPAGFEIDGNLVSSPGGQDWFSAGGIGVIDTLTCAGNPSQLPATFGHDNEWRTGIDGKFKTMSNKNDDDIGANAKPWHWESFGGNPQKNDITEIFAHSRTDGAGHGWIMMAAGTRAPMGDNHTDFEFNQAGLTITGDTGGLIVGNGPQGGRTVGDLLVSVDEINGGRNPVPTLRRWDGTQFVIIPESEWTGKFYAANNDTVAVAPCGAVNRKGDKVGAYDVDQFLEVAFRADLLLTPTAGACGNPATVMVKTRSSQSWTAELKDFALAGLGTPAAPECAISGPTTLCPRHSIQLCGPEGSNLTWSWSTGETSRCITVSSGGTYTLTVTGPGCPPTTCSTLVTEVTAPLCSVTGPDSLCAGKTAQLCGPEGSGLGYSWSTGAHTRCITIDALLR